MTKDFADKVFTVLVEQLQAPEHARSVFVMSVADERWPVDHWALNQMGFGIDYFPETNTVKCLPEDETEGRLVLIEEANKELKFLEQNKREAV